MERVRETVINTQGAGMMGWQEIKEFLKNNKGYHGANEIGDAIGITPGSVRDCIRRRMKWCNKVGIKELDMKIIKKKFGRNQMINYCVYKLIVE